MVFRIQHTEKFLGGYDGFSVGLSCVVVFHGISFTIILCFHHMCFNDLKTGMLYLENTKDIILKLAF